MVYDTPVNAWMAAPPNAVCPGRHLNQAGVSLARRAGETIGPFDRVITSTECVRMAFSV